MCGWKRRCSSLKPWLCKARPAASCSARRGWRILHAHPDHAGSAVDRELPDAADLQGEIRRIHLLQRLHISARLFLPRFADEMQRQVQALPGASSVRAAGRPRASAESGLWFRQAGR